MNIDIQGKYIWLMSSVINKNNTSKSTPTENNIINRLFKNSFSNNKVYPIYITHMQDNKFY